ncbi:phage major capsid protein [Pseudoclavibacter sp. 13-3]|uniref:phage major capsid protein n=1 Tax=Pseudoclavibacter sp. 13-3 TaxID=2901228 RepID=UPI001E371235|nr:phage major capsid protein [Pseudoclavibacter sp. 13-3]MCD7101959.1 phage major capsid protein [Pseudoclavibacter sp. 13-3]
MALPNSDLTSVFGRTEIGPMLLDPLASTSVATEVSTVVRTNTRNYRFPIVASDPTSSWVAEGDEIPSSEGSARDVPVDIFKIAALTWLTNEAADDTDPAAADVLSDGLVRDLANQLDEAFFTSRGASTVRSAGLPDLPGVQTVEADPTTGFDPFIDALAAAEAKGAAVNTFVTTPEVARALAKVRTGAGSNALLLGGDAQNGVSRSVLGVPLLVSAHVEPGVVWAIPSAASYVVIREDARVDVDTSARFTSDSIGIRAVSRVGFAFPQPNRIVKIGA